MDYSTIDLTGIRGVVFDYGGVIAEAPRKDAPMFVLCRSIGLSDDAWDKGFADYRHLWDGGMISGNELYRRILADNGIENPSEELLEKLWRVDSECWGEKPIPETLDYMRELRKRGYKVGILTNMSVEFYEDYFTPRFKDYVAEADAVVISGLEKMYKPRPEIYGLMETRIGLKPSELLFLDDLQKNVEAARDCGWHSILVK